MQSNSPTFHSTLATTAPITRGPFLKLLLCACAMTAHEAWASIIVQDNFDSYTSGELLDGKDGGSGWDNGWTADSSVIWQRVFVDGDVAIAPGSSNSIRFDHAGGGGPTTPQASRLFDVNQPFIAGEPVYFSAWVQFDDVNAVGQNGGFRVVGMGDETFSNNTWGFGLNSAGQITPLLRNADASQSSSQSLQDNTPHLISVRFIPDMNTTDRDIIDIWIDPLTAPSDLNERGDAWATGGEVSFWWGDSTNWTGISLRGVAGVGNSFHSWVDDLRVTEEFTAIPEPGTLMLLGIAGIAGLISHRRRKR
ncbi:MAG: PEP-CTERM sorting domain-containing protein [Verrucomicrobia bacterium]|nr:PEP-CTERM sorting domain-containing protein [Verrucomicrobiota bacterium]